MNRYAYDQGKLQSETSNRRMLLVLDRNQKIKFEDVHQGLESFHFFCVDTRNQTQMYVEYCWRNKAK